MSPTPFSGYGPAGSRRSRFLSTWAAARASRTNVFSADVDGRAGVAILLTYGPNRDWLKNITAAGGGRMRRYGKTFGVANPRRLTKAEAAPYVSSRWRPVFARLPFDEAVLLTKAD